MSILRSRLGGGMTLLWVALVVAAFLGSIAWFFIGRRDTRRRAAFR